MEVGRRIVGQTLTRLAALATLSRREKEKRRGSATIDYFLLICIVLPLAAFMMVVAPRAMRSVYDLLTVMVAWPFM